METKMFKRIFSSLLGLSLLLGMNNLSFAAANEFALEQTTANITLTFSNAALTEGAEVRANVQVKFSTADPAATGTTKLCSIGIPIEFPFADLDYADPAFIAPGSGSPFGSSGTFSNKTNIGAFTLQWGNGASDVTVPVNTNLDLGTVVFKLKSQKDGDYTLNFSVDDEDTSFTNEDSDESALSTHAEDFAFSYNLRSCDHPNMYKATWIRTKDPTCTEKGDDSWTCDECNGVQHKDVAALGHSYQCQSISDTQHQNVCNRCGEQEGSASDHEWSAITSVNDSQHKKTCSRCGHSVTEDHSFGPWSEDNNASCTENGTRSRECPCGLVVYEENPSAVAIGHAYVETSVASDDATIGGTRHKCSRCGDEYWTDFYRDESHAQTLMPNGETVYHYCTHNDLAAETTVNLTDSTTLRVFIQDPLRVLKKNDSDVLGINVTYVEPSSQEYADLLKQVDDTHKIERINFFMVNPTVNGAAVTGDLDGSVYMEYEIPEGWDEDQLEMILVQEGDDQEFDETVLEIDGKKYLAMWKNHFSPYAMIDKLTEEEQAALNLDKLTAEQKAQLNAALESLSKEELAQLKETVDSSSTGASPKTGDEVTYLTISGLGLMMTLALGLMLNSKITKKKSDE